LKNDIYSEEVTARLTQSESEYLERENRARIETQNQVLILKEQVIQRQQTINILAIAISIVSIILVFVFLRSNKQRKFINELLDKKVIERTRELERSRDQWLKKNEERDVLISRYNREVKRSLCAIKGLSILISKNVNDPHVKEYVEKLNMAMDDFSAATQNFHSTSEL
jgi:nitrogen-specific signal transduction histidine kinase